MRIDDIARYIYEDFTSRGLKLDTMQISRLLYYCQAWHLALSPDDTAPLFDEDAVAFPKGPTYLSIFEQNRRSYWVEQMSGDASAVRSDPTVKALVDRVVSRYGKLSGEGLSILSVTEGPYFHTRRGNYGGKPLRVGETSRRVIPKGSMREYYRDLYFSGQDHVPTSEPIA